MIWLRSAGVVIYAASGVVAWLLLFNFAVIVTHANLGFCDNAVELLKPDPNCPEPWWYWVGNTIVPVILVLGAIKKIRQISREDKN